MSDAPVAVPARSVGRRAVLAGMAAAPALSAPAFAQGRFDWKKHQGARISVLFQKSPRSDLLAANQREFEELTGIKVAFEAIPEQQQRQKMVVEFASGAPSFDVANISIAVQKRLVERGGWFTDLRPMLTALDRADPAFKAADFSPAIQQYGSGRNGALVVLPINLDYWVVYYNKELLERAKLPVPQSFDELVRAAAAIHKPDANTYGWVCRGQKNANVPVWTTLLLGWNQETIDKDGRLLTTTPAAIEAAKLYAKLAREYGPAGMSGFNWGECQTSFAQGRAGFWLDGIGFAAPLEDPKRSRVAGKVGYAVLPKGPTARHTALFGDGLGVSEASKNKEAALLYVAWATGMANQARMLKVGAGVPARSSPLSDPDSRTDSVFGREWFTTLVDSGRIARSPLPQVQPVTEFRDIFGVALSNILEGADAKTELTRATEAFQPVLDASERA